ncbi:SGNH/GDSL hydrolase family protein [Nesterenkonia aerolata]|uniref:SGNH/GDSL hydrolase family protein n=1 Tax=Nesterenkonia aerolata TaxID=3074079 RepID=A0ABU2DTP9_9MICC|nr:SGNH/GDSL hydrolase family protein [Nesterenkonia sp. LY-0111]MDR8019755.1 SGNH/GDSL hydrolase family protein [Nesterenkonia sp. LY-0111]
MSRERKPLHPLLLPIAAIQGARVRQHGMRLPEAAGPRDGVVGALDGGSGEPLRVAVIGDSTAAGCGVEAQSEAFGPQFAEAVAGRTGQPVEWAVRGRNGARAFEVTRDVLPQLDDAPGGPQFDVVVVLVGVNDVLSGHQGSQWEQDLGALLDGASAAADQVLMTGIPEFSSFPALPKILARYLDEQAARLDDISQQVCADREVVTWLGADMLATGKDFFAVDGFHPNADGYRRWAQAVAENVNF